MPENPGDEPDTSHGEAWTAITQDGGNHPDAGTAGEQVQVERRDAAADKQQQAETEHSE